MREGIEINECTWPVVPKKHILQRVIVTMITLVLKVWSLQTEPVGSGVNPDV